MTSPVRVAMLGCGTVGSGVARLLRRNAAAYEARVGAPLELTAVLTRREHPRPADLAGLPFTRDPEKLFGEHAFDVVIEVMGGIDPSHGYVRRALDQGIPVITANKMLLAVHGPELLAHAARSGAGLAFEGAVGGGIPIVRTLRDALASDRVVRLRGIVNGTSNYILTRMREARLSFAEALTAAQAAGYAEADPALDVGGGDAAHKLVVLAMLAFGAEVDHEAVPTEGITDVELIDHDMAARFGFALKHLAVAELAGGDEEGRSLELRVHPALVPLDAPLANVNGVLNAIELEGEALGPCVLVGRGAGEQATAVSVVADLLDIARSLRGAALPTAKIALRKTSLRSSGQGNARHYLRFPVFDRPGVLARITGALGEARVSIEQMVQQGRGDTVQVVMLTHEAQVDDVRRALAEIGKGDYLAGKVRSFRVA
jgi:homoserine dehydrogenase